MDIKKFIFMMILRLGKEKEKERKAQQKAFNVEESRKNVEIFNKTIGLLQPKKEDIALKKTYVNEVPCLRAHNPSKTKRTILYLHGGAYIKSLKHLSCLYEYFSAELATTCEAEVWVPDYRLAPEHPYPAALEDAYSVYQSLIDKGVSPQNLVIMGDSSGGGLTLSLLMKLRDRKNLLPKAAVTLSAWTDLALTGKSMKERDNLDPMFSFEPFADIPPLIVERNNEKDPYISPLYGSFEDLPPLMMFVGGQEILYDDTLRVAKKAKQARIEVKLNINESMPHVYPVFSGIFSEGKIATEQLALFIKQNTP